MPRDSAYHEGHTRKDEIITTIFHIPTTQAPCHRRLQGDHPDERPETGGASWKPSGALSERTAAIFITNWRYRHLQSQIKEIVMLPTKWAPCYYDQANVNGIMTVTGQRKSELI